MKASFIILSLLASSQAAMARDSLASGSAAASIPSLSLAAYSTPNASTEAAASIKAQSTAASALANVAGDAQKLADNFKDDPGIGGTQAGIYLDQLSDEARVVKSKASSLAKLIKEGADQDVIDAALDDIAEAYANIRGLLPKTVNQLNLLSKPAESYQIDTAFTKIRSRWVYLQGLLN